MFAKLSALTLCLSFVSALDITVPVEVYAGTSVALNVGTDPSDPSYIGLSLVSNEVYVELVADVVVAPTIYVDIPESIFPGNYVIDAFYAGDSTAVIAQSNSFVIESA